MPADHCVDSGSGQSPAAGGEDVADIVVCRADHAVDVGLVLAEQGAGIVVAVEVSVSASV